MREETKKRFQFVFDTQESVRNQCPEKLNFAYLHFSQLHTFFPREELLLHFLNRSLI